MLSDQCFVENSEFTIHFTVGRLSISTSVLVSLSQVQRGQMHHRLHIIRPNCTLATKKTLSASVHDETEALDVKTLLSVFANTVDFFYFLFFGDHANDYDFTVLINCYTA